MDMDDREMDIISKAVAVDFTAQTVITNSEKWVKFAAHCKLDNTHHTIKLFPMDEVMETNTIFETEKQISMKLKYHKNVSTLLTSFVGGIPESFLKLLPKNYLDSESKKFCFHVYKFYPQTLATWLSGKVLPLKFQVVLGFATDILKGVQHISKEGSMIRIGIDNLMIDENDKIVLADFTMPTAHAQYDFASQASFTAGCLISEILSDNFPLSYPRSFRSIVRDLMSCDQENRLTINEALNQLKICFSNSLTLVLHPKKPCKLAPDCLS